MKTSAFIASVFSAFALGGAGMWAWQHHSIDRSEPVTAAAAQPDSQLQQLAQLGKPAPQAAPAVPGMDPFQEMERMRQRMEAFFDHDDFFGGAGFAGNMGSLFQGMPVGMSTDIQAGEDKNSVFYKLEVGDQDVSNVDVNVQNGYVSISAELSSKSNNGYAQSSVSESFPVPAGVDPNSAKVKKEGDAVVIRFDKVS
jgi:HSP20 family molecular chaperone IbpA